MFLHLAELLLLPVVLGLVTFSLLVAVEVVGVFAVAVVVAAKWTRSLLIPRHSQQAHTP
jgi:hypothetical protein